MEPGLQGPGGVASFDSLEAACCEHRIISSKGGQCSGVPRAAHFHLPSLGLCQDSPPARFPGPARAGEKLREALGHREEG